MTASEGLDLMEYDWCYTRRGTHLHHATLSVGLLDELSDGGIAGTIVADCGQVMNNPWVPGLSPRMSMPRCEICCSHLGYPPGVGSPKNDPACLPLVEARLTTLTNGS